MPTLYDALALLLTTAAAFAYLNHRFLKLPMAIGLMVLALLASLGLLGLGKLGVAPVLDVARLVDQLDFSALLMQVMLGFLLFAGAINVDARRLGELRWPVGLLATLGTVLSTGLVGGALYWLLPLLGLPVPLLPCLLFGALISPTDPVAVLSILTKANIPRSLELKIVGESLFNDGVGVVIFTTLLHVAEMGTGHVPLRQTLLLFAQEAGGGLLLGTGLGLGTAWLLRTIDNYQVEVLLTLALVTGGTALATRLHTSGPLAMVMAGLLVGYFSRRGSILSEVSQDYVDKFWELIDEILNALLFVLMGLELLVLPLPGRTLLAGGLAVLVLLAARVLAVAVPLGLLRIGRQHPPERHAVKVLTWGGLRGGLAVALALALPTTQHRELLVGMTYIVVVFSIIGQGLTIGPLVRRLGLATEAQPQPHEETK
ncbi:MAG: cation:proton antiporter [Janthinobacterium lividum]